MRQVCNNRTPTIDYDRLRALEAQIRAMDLSHNTRVNYCSAWRSFQAWCEVAGLPYLPASPRTVCDFITWCLTEGYRTQTVTVRTAAIAYFHRLEGAKSPITSEVHAYTWQAKRLLRHRARGKRAITLEMLRRICNKLDGGDAVAIRNWAMILVCFAAGFRRSEISRLSVADVTFAPQGMVLHLAYSKTDQAGRGRDIPIPRGEGATCPVEALRRWLAVRGEWQGALFVQFDPKRKMTEKPVSPAGYRLYEIVKALLKSIGEDARQFGAHSLRAGMITAAARNGASEFAIMQRTGHKSSETLRGYIRPANLFELDPLKGVL